MKIASDLLNYCLKKKQKLNVLTATLTDTSKTEKKSN